MSEAELICKISGAAVYRAVKEALRQDETIKRQVQSALDKCLGGPLQDRIMHYMDTYASPYTFNRIVKETVMEEVRRLSTQSFKNEIEKLLKEIVEETFSKSR